MRKYLKRRSKSILEQAEAEWGDQDEKYEKLEEDLKRLREVLEGLAEEGGKRIGRMHREYLWAEGPNGKQKEAKKEKASAGYRMRMLDVGVVEQVAQDTPAPKTPQALGLDGTNNASERAIGRSKVRYKTMRGYKSMDGMKNGIVLTQ